VDNKTDRFNQANGMRYVRFLSRVLDQHIFDWYLEVGCRTGRIFQRSRGKTIAVDPYFQVESNVIGIKPALHVFQKTSDDFFASKFLEALNVNLSFSFLDGMHLFEYLLRDFIETEMHSTSGSLIALHDCCPFSHEMATRDLCNLPKGNWTGDVWKLIPILKQFRPDLTVRVLDCAPTGLVLISGLDPKSRTLRESYDDIVSQFEGLDLRTFGVDSFNELFEYESATDFLSDSHVLFDKVTQAPDTALKPMKITP
jgi:hypothetical protein